MVKRRTSATERSRKYFSEGTEDECWHWTGYVMKNGYGAIHRNGRSVTAHRVVYEVYNGPIPAGLHVDHVCHNRAGDCLGGPTCLHRRCVNPAHLEATTNAVNVSRGAVARAAARGGQVKTCAHGWRPIGEDCRVCARERAAEYRLAQKAGLALVPHGECINCREYKRVMARGLCNACYLRQYRAKKKSSSPYA